MQEYKVKEKTVQAVKYRKQGHEEVPGAIKTIAGEHVIYMQGRKVVLSEGDYVIYRSESPIGVLSEAEFERTWEPIEPIIVDPPIIVEPPIEEPIKPPIIPGPIPIDPPITKVVKKKKSSK